LCSALPLGPNQLRLGLYAHGFAVECKNILLYQLCNARFLAFWSNSFIDAKISSCGEAMMPASDNVLLACPRCGASMHLFESFPAQSWLPEVHVFECDLCKEMILRDRNPESAT